MAKKFTVEDIDKRMDDVRERVRARQSAVPLATVKPPAAGPVGVQDKLLAAARKRAAKVFGDNPDGSLI